MKKMMVIGLGMIVVMFLGVGTLYACGCGGMGHGGETMGQGEHGKGNDGDIKGNEDMGAPAGHQHSGQQQGQPIAKAQAKQLLEDHIKLKENPNIKLGKITEGQDYFEAEVVTTKNGDLVDKIRVNKKTGSLESVYQGNSPVLETPKRDKGHVH